MNPRRNRPKEQFLDVSDLTVSDPRMSIPSPRRTPIQTYQNDIPTPHNLPIVIEVGGLALSPYFQTGGMTDIQFFDFTLEGPEDSFEEEQEENDNLDEIGEEDEIMEESQQNLEQEDKIQEQEPLEYIQAYNSTLNLPYFNEAYEELKKMGATKKELREFVMEYLTQQDYQNQDIEDKGIEELKKIARYNLRYIGPISWLERKSKVRKYISKKNRRIWKKKISYDCRKRVADNRLRVKGKFVTKKQACKMLGVDEQQEEDKLKQLLVNKVSK